MEIEKVVADLKIDSIYLKAFKNVMLAMISVLFEKEGMSSEKFSEMLDKMITDEIQKLAATDPMLEDEWKERMKNDLGDIKGIDL